MGLCTTLGSYCHFSYRVEHLQVFFLLTINDEKAVVVLVTIRLIIERAQDAVAIHSMCATKTGIVNNLSKKNYADGGSDGLT